MVNSIGQRLRQARKESQMSLRALAELSGVGQSTIGMIERGHTENPGMLTVNNLAIVLRVPPMWLALGGERGK